MLRHDLKQKSLQLRGFGFLATVMRKNVEVLNFHTYSLRSSANVRRMLAPWLGV